MATSRNAFLTALLASGSFTLLAAGSGCTIVTTNDPVDSGTPNPDGSAADGGAHVLGFLPSNIGAALDGVDTSKLIDLDVTGTGAAPSGYCNSQPNDGCVAKTVIQSDGSTLQVYFAKSWKIEPTTNFGVTDKMPVAIVALTTIQILGTVKADADQLFAIAGGFGAVPSEAVKGPGPGGGGWTGASPSIGGGGGGHCGAGGNGGALAGTRGVAGATNGTATLIPLGGGSAGGGANSGAGGGVVQFVAGTSIEIGANATVSAGGGAGGRSSQASQYGSGGTGGGAGGGLLFEAPTVTVSGKIAVNGGGGGGASADGSNATPDSNPAAGGNAGQAHAGGNGSAGATVAGADGAIGDVDNGGAGGGGGAGYIRINTSSGAATITGALSPSTGSACATQGTLAH